LIITQLEGTVPSDQWDTLKQAFEKAAQQLPSAIEHSYLIQDRGSRDTWRVLTVWKSWEALQDYRATVETPGGMLMFQAAGAEPSLSIGDVVEHAHQD
jgi:hypothetical protein